MVAGMVCLLLTPVFYAQDRPDESLQGIGTSESEIRRLPSWFLKNRVHGFTRLHINDPRFGLDTPEFLSAASAFRSLGASVFTRHVKTRCEDPWWPTAVPPGVWSGVIQLEVNQCDPSVPVTPGHSVLGRNVVEEIVNEARGQAMRMIAYHFFHADRTLAGVHPEWVCRDVRGGIARDRRGRNFMDVSSPFREVNLGRLLELASMGVGGFYFDEFHMPRQGCFDTSLEEKFRKATGLEPPATAEEGDPLFRLYLRFQASEVEKAFAYWQREVKRRFPHVVFVVSTEALPTLVDSRTTTNLIRLADSSKTEYQTALQQAAFDLDIFPAPDLAQPEDDIRMAMGWTLHRDSAEGRPPHIWSCFSLPSTEHALQFAGSLLSHGAIANIDAPEAQLIEGGIPGPRCPSGLPQTPREALKAAFSLGRAVSPHLRGTRPLRWAAVHFSELARNHRGGDHVRAWREVLWPATGAFGVLLRAGLPFGLVNDVQLSRGDLAGYRVLFLPNPDELTQEQRRAVRHFVARGGLVLRNRPEWHWSDPAGTDAAHAALRSELLAVHRRRAPARVRVTVGPKRMHAVAFEDEEGERLVVAVTNDFSGLVSLFIPPFRVNLPPPPIDGAEVSIRGRLPGRVFEVLTGAPLLPVPVRHGYKVRLPRFETMALLVAETR